MSIAVIGMAGRFPGAPSLERYWENLARGVESVVRLTPDDLAAAGVDPAVAADPRYVPARPVLEEVDLFDADLFGYTPREAELIDPQQRVFLECAWAALEDAGHDPSRFGGQIGLFAGTSLNSYLLNNLLASGGGLDAAASFQALTASDKDYLATRASYKLDLRGPSLTVQTACSTSLVALHLACESLYAGECEMAVAGGVSVVVPQRTGYTWFDGGIYSPDGHCRPFDAAAAGTLFGSGAGVVVLRRLADALADGDPIRAVVLGSAVNNDGARKVGYTAPGVDGQAEVIAEALEVAGVEPATVGYVEAHGTGTPMGDPIEVEALNRAFGGDRLPPRSCALGSVKSNFGHLEAAAGIAGLIKTVLALEHRRIPPTVHFERPNPAIRFGPFHVADRLLPFETAGEPRRAGVSSFGIGGTNVHVVLEEAPVRPPDPAGPVLSWDPAAAGGSEVLVLSARTPAALNAAAGRLAHHLSARPDLPLADVAHTLQRGRRQLEHRRTLVARSAAEAAEALAAGRGRSAHRPAGYHPVAFLFPGQGAQHPGMGAGLHRRDPVFRRELDRLAEGFGPHLELDLRGVLLADGEEQAARLERTEIAQPALFAVEYALARAWIERGVEPDALLGHSVGEWVAACLAGVVSLDDALALVAVRGRLMAERPPGAMAGVALGEEELRPRLPDGVEIAAVNAGDRITVSGPEPAVAELCRALAADGVRATRLATSHAFHSAAMDGAVEPFLAEVRKRRLEPPAIPFLSNVTGTWIIEAEATSPAYWAHQLRAPVRFADGLRELAAKPGRVLLECGPGETLTRLARRAGAADRAIPSLPDPRAGGDDAGHLAEAVGRLWLAGVEIDWRRATGGGGKLRRRVSLPTYPFERRRFWVEPRPRPRRGGLDRRSDVADFFHLPAWRQAPLPPPLAPGGDGDAEWLLLDGGSGAAEPLAALLARHGRRVAVEAAPPPADYEALLARHARGDGPLHLVHLGHLPPLPEGDGPAAGEPSGELAVFDLLALGRALTPNAGLEGRRDVRLTVVASCLFRVRGDEAVSPERATLLGPCRVMPRELPNVRCRVVDAGAEAASPAPDPRALERLAAELCDPGAGNEPVAWRGGRRWRLGFEPVRIEAPAAAPPAGTWLITGGLGGVGLTLASRLAEVPGTRLALLGRTPVPPGDERLERLAARGAEVLAVSADVADREGLERALAEVRRRFGPVTGVIHAAGVPGGAALATTTEAAARAVLAPKVAGTRNLAAALAGDPVEHLVLCSSLLAQVGVPGQAAYAAANAFLDAFAHERAAAGGTPAVAVAWGPWAEVGMAAAGSGAAATPEGASPALGRLDPARDWVLSEHVVMGRPVLPGTAYLEMAAAAAFDPAGGTELRDVLFLAPLVAADGPVEVRLDLDGGVFRVRGRAAAGAPWREHARGLVVPAAPEAPPRHDLAEIRRRCPRPAEPAAEAGPAAEPPIAWGPHWQSLRSLHLGDGEAVAEVELDPELAGDLERWVLHPALLDAAGAFASRAAGDGLYLPLSYGRVRVRRPLPARFTSWVRRRPPEGPGGGSSEVTSFDLTLLDEEGRELVAIEDYALKRFRPEALVQGAQLAPSAPPPSAEAGRLTPAEGAEALVRLLAHAPGEQVAVLPVDLAALVERLESPGAGAAPPPPAHPRPEVSTPFVAPRPGTEERLAAVWRERLGVDRVGAEDNFFELGGDSVIAVQVIARAHELGLELTPADLFRAPTVAALAARVAAGREEPREEAEAPATPPEQDEEAFGLADLDRDEMASVLARFRGGNE
jgi:acyl transferase domain-containing protein